MCKTPFKKDSGVLEFISDQRKTQKMYEKDVNGYPFMLEFFP